MRLEIRLWLYLGTLHAMLALVLVWQRELFGWWLFPLEIALLLSFLLGLKLMRLAAEPLRLARTFSDVVRSGEYGSRYASIGHAETDDIIATYNLMLSNLQQERLRAGEQRGFLERFLEVSPVGVLICDFDERVSLANPRARELLDAAAGCRGAGCGCGLVGRALRALEGSPLARALATLGVGETRLVTDASGRRLRCQRSEFYDRGFPRAYVLIEELTAELDRTERTTYEKLIRMMSHEVTNSVAATNSLLGSCLNYAGDIENDEHREDFENALRVLIARNRSLNEFTVGLSELVKLPAPHRQEVDLRELASAVGTVFRGELEQRGIVLAVDIADDLPQVSMDRNQMEQVLINVVKNAIEAIDRSGRIELRAQREGRGITLVVTDDGAGLSAEASVHLFTPFYTSKPHGQGLGLTLVKEILTQHGFGFSLETSAGRTRFRIEVPAAEA